MSVNPDAEAIWNRSRAPSPHATRTGDKHALNARDFSDRVREFGFASPFRFLPIAWSVEAADAFRYLALFDAADAIEEALAHFGDDDDVWQRLESAPSEEERTSLARYAARVPDTQSLKRAVARTYAKRPNDFDPILPGDYEPENHAEEFDEADRIWNRALTDEALERPGDLALKAIFRFHNLVLSGGFDYAFDTDFEAATPAIEGWQHLGAPEPAELIDRGRSIFSRLGSTNDEVDVLDLDEEETAEIQKLGERYSDWDDMLEDVFRTHLSAHSDESAPVELAGLG